MQSPGERDCEPRLSADCSLKHLMGSAAAMEILNPWISQVKNRAAKMGRSEEFLSLVSRMTLRDIMGLLGMEKDAADQLDQQLRGIENTAL